MLCVAAACSPDKTPTDETGGGPGAGQGQSGGITSIAALKEMYVNRPVTIDTEITVRGRVVSSDRWGNFYKTLCIEDHSGGIALRVDLVDYFRTFEFGAEITVYCNTLTLGVYGGALQLGVAPGDNSNNIAHIPESYLLSSVSLTPTSGDPPVNRRSIATLLPSDVYRYAEITEVQFEDWTEGMPWCEEDTDTDRYIIDREGNRLAVRTSRYAEFARYTLPGGSGRIRGVVGYFNGAYQLTVSGSEYVEMEGGRF